MGRRLPGKAIPARPARILVVKLVGFGSILLAGPLVAAARAACPDAQLELLTRPAHATLFEASFDRVFSLDSRVCAALWRDPPDLVLDLEAGSRLTGSLGRAIGAPTAGFSLPGWCPPHEVSVRFRESVHASTNYLRLADALGWPDGPLAPLPLGISAGQKDAFAVLNPNASELAPERRWPHFAVLGRRFLAEGIPVVVIGGPEDVGRVTALVAALGGGARSALGLDLRGCAELLARARVVVSNDSGPAHLAAAVGAPTVVLFGPETPATHRPLGPRVTVLHRPLPCSPCLSTWDGKVAACRRKVACLADLHPNQVWEAAAECLG